ncbi:MAG: phosphatidate cytidylyltransferase [Dehalococcoidia bacterium]|jgi:phosphatidate cytidylyltransferase|nr:phosphatidate cytidylyltransferase [Dehalococcoidia bacterium]
MTLRIVTAAIAIPALLGAVWLGTPAIAAVVLLAAAISGWELADMVRARSLSPLRWAYIAWPISLVITGWLVAENQAGWWVMLATAGTGTLIAFYLLATGRRTAFVYAVVAGPYVGVALAHAPILRSIDDGAQWLLLALIVTFAADTAAMLTGVTFGRHKLMPRISPNKSWEGLIGALAGGGIAALVVEIAFDLEIATAMAVVLGVVMAIAGTLGDLGESAFKRRAGVKDSGFLIPGHGGVLDRLDSLLPNLVIVYWVSEWSTT